MIGTKGNINQCNLSNHLVLEERVVQIDIKTACKRSISWNPFNRVGHFQYSTLFEWLGIFLGKIYMNDLQPKAISLEN